VAKVELGINEKKYLAEKEKNKNKIAPPPREVIEEDVESSGNEGSGSGEGVVGTK